MDSGRDGAAISSFWCASRTFVDPATEHNVALCWFKIAARRRQAGLPSGTAEERSQAACRRALALNPAFGPAAKLLRTMDARRPAALR
jgi:hypothetical protein